MATYLNDLRLTELATGEGSGTWGTTTNLSLELIGEALGFATQQVFGSDADATTTIADGASDPARAMYFKITSAGSLTATRTCTIAPNTISRVMFIENATTGSQSIQISQGSGASVTILAGKTAVVYLDGAGSGAAVVDAMAGVDPGVTDTLAEVLAAGNTSGANNLIIDNGQAITTNTINETTAASGVTIDSVLLKDDGVNATNLEITNLKANDGTSAGSIADSTGVVTLASSVLTTADINGGTIDGTTLGATTPASVAATTGTFSGVVTANAGVVVDNFTLDGTTLALSSGDLTLDAAGDINLDSDTGYVLFKDAGTEHARIFQNNSGDVNISSQISDKDMKFLGNDGGVGFTALTLDMSEAGAATFSGTVTATQFSSTNSNASTPSFGVSAGNGMYNAGTNILGFSTNSLNRMTLDASGDLTTTGAATFGGEVNVTYAGNLNTTVKATNSSAGTSALARFIAVSDGGNAQLTATSTTYTDIAGAADSMVLNASSLSGGIKFANDGVVDMTLDASGDLTTTGAATFGGNVVGLTFESSVSSSSTNLATNSGGSLTLKNTSVTDGNFSNIGGYNSNTLVTSQINFVNVSQASRTGAITFNVHNGTSMPEVGRFDASGNFLVGTTSVFSGSGITPLMTVSKSAGSGIGVNLIGSSEVGLATRPSADHNYYAGFFLNNAGTGVGNITVGSSTTAYNTSSDERLKENITDANDAGNKIDAIKVRQYDWKADGSHQDYGMIAQELMTVAPEAVSAPEDPEQMMGVDYSKLVPMMLKEIQSLRARISQLEGAN
jgi:hypothetical protein